MDKEDSRVDTVFTKNRNNISLIYCGEDVLKLTNHKSETFNTLVGGNTQLLLFSHGTDSAEKWSEYFGEEYQEKLERGETEGVTKTGFFGGGTHKGVAINKRAEKDYKYLPQTFKRRGKTKDINGNDVILGLNDGECYFVNNSLEASVRITNIGKLTRISLHPTQLIIESHS